MFLKQLAKESNCIAPAEIDEIDEDLEVFGFIGMHVMERITRNVFWLVRTGTRLLTLSKYNELDIDLKLVQYIVAPKKS